MEDGPVTTVLPKELRLGAPPTMPQARSYLFRQQSTLASYNPDDQIQINIPRLQRSYLRKDSYLQFRLNGQYQPGDLAEDGTLGVLKQFAPDLLLDDAGAWSLFERMEVFDYLGSTVLESTDGIPQLISCLIDMGQTFTDPDHEGVTAHGLNDPYVATNNTDNLVEYGVLGNTYIGIPGEFNSTNNVLSVTVDGVTIANTLPGTTGANTLAYASNEACLEIIQNWLGDLEVSDPRMIGFRARLTQSGTTAGRSIDIYNTLKTFTLNAPTNHMLNKLGITAAATAPGTNYTFPKAADTIRTTAIVADSGIGKQFYCGGKPLVSVGQSRAPTLKSFSVQFSIPLPSFLGFLSKKMVPLHNGFTIVLTLASQYKPMFIAPKQVPTLLSAPTDPGDKSNVQVPVEMEAVNTNEPRTNVANINGPTRFVDPKVFWWQITDVSMVCQILELGPVAESMILSSTQGQPLILHTKQIRNYKGSAGATAAEFSLPLNLNVASLTNLLWFMRPDGTDNNLSYASVGARTRNHLWRWEFQYGSTVLPQSQGIQSMYMTGPSAPSGKVFPSTGAEYFYSINNGFTECYNEFMKSRPSNAFRGRLTPENYSASTYLGKGDVVGFAHTPWICQYGDSATTYDICKFACGLNLELVNGKVGDLICGLNTNGMNTTIRGYFHPQLLTNTNKFLSIVDAYAEYDAFINISPGIVTTISF